ncbi:hypothetical protein CDAR_400881 [Caerostris darwini]|uniref:Uncharacterized protein n=1 Tax=Caerostris darwini TaxID=1538125 RepID=A0AAV4SVK0_9ARAC|nr:hypothetical protein CDAR_400881 [Caerostris darwini]
MFHSPTLTGFMGKFDHPLIGKSRRCPKPHSNSLNCDFPDEHVAADNLPDSYRVNQVSNRGLMLWKEESGQRWVLWVSPLFRLSLK